VRIGLAVAALLVVLVVGGLLARSWVMQQYYVGTDSDAASAQIVIYQGVRGSVLGVPLQTVAQRSTITLSDLPEDARNNVRTGIPASDGLAGAQATLRRLESRMLPVCQPAPTPDPHAQQGQPTDPNAPPVDSTPLPTVTPEPGVTCRPAG
jgi:protein phosphatase